VLQLAFYGAMAVAICAMLEASASYLDLGVLHPIYLDKLPLPHPQLWLTALYVHVPSALLSLPACLLLSAAWPRRRWPRLHRWLGRFAGVLVVFAAVPSGLYLAFFAEGGWPSTLGFLLTSVITLVAMLKSVAAVRAGHIAAHRRYSAHVTAQLSVAVSSRILLIGAELFELRESWVYAAALWLPVLASAAVAEWVVRPRNTASSKGTHHETPVLPRAVHVVR
jgi:uncharacterized membrane protein